MAGRTTTGPQDTPDDATVDTVIQTGSSTIRRNVDDGEATVIRINPGYVADNLTDEHGDLNSDLAETTRLPIPRTAGTEEPTRPAGSGHSRFRATRNPPMTSEKDRLDVHGDHARQATANDEDAQTWINPDSTEGTAITNLFRRLKAVEEPDGAWPGADVVDVLNVWLPSIGLHPDDDPDQAVQRLRTRPHPWTVFGLRTNDGDSETLIAAVAAGEIDCLDTDSGDEGGYQRVAESVVAADPEEAEHKAYELFEADCDD
ncbi:hypothetical protein [Saccharomonospora saliphila]|uniref:hypothetical protein n=1 Tax=Saccharomonospora saliphila TaxID=369829 RepID=UPI00036C9583|nr:hypothetical protein [Saccharomonospora saliphila]